MKDLIKDLQKDIPKVKAHIMGAIKRSDIQGWNIQDNDKNQCKKYNTLVFYAKIYYFLIFL